MYHNHNKDTQLDIFPVDSELTADKKVVSGLITLARVINPPPVTERSTISALHEPQPNPITLSVMLIICYGAGK